jgi:hypothetical protein
MPAMPARMTHDHARHGATSLFAALDLHLDDHPTHKTSKVKQWLSRHPRFHLHFTPELEADVRHWINEWNADIEPFRLDQDRRRHPQHPRRTLSANY